LCPSSDCQVAIVVLTMLAVSLVLLQSKWGSHWPRIHA
jgi:hypothetical protein